MRRKCYNEWVQVRRCAVKNMGDTFAMKINMTRQIEDYEDEEAIIENYKLYYENKKFLHRYEKIQGPPAEEEAAEGEEGEPAEEEGSSEENAEESSEEKTEEAAAGEEKTEESTEGEPASDESRDSPVNEDGSAGDAVEHTEIKAEEESDE